MKRICIFFIVILYPSLVYTKLNTINSNNFPSRPDMIASIYREIAKVENNIKKETVKNGIAYSLDLDYYQSQRKAIFEKCAIYGSLGGQRAEILESQCELDAVSEFYDFIKTYRLAKGDT
ncbi:hypothetical protein ABK905_21320 [Acerihabitans sp. KWT182]|uniref:DUF1311 domain-containing protein n=1 Tax=Acerihabitans sp. KWT182 TaxID=3157919 RepID=A0AAU7Q756_9GAMM